MHVASLVGKVASYVSKTEVFHKLFGNGTLATSRGTHDNAVQHLSLHLYTINGLLKVEWPLVELCGSTSNHRIVSTEYALKVLFCSNSASNIYKYSEVTSTVG